MVLANANNLMALGLRVGDALHLASAVEGEADFFLTTDDKILRKVTDFEGVIVLDPIRMVEKIDEYDN
jgi:predicted nucleic acid-binding protein